MENSQIKINGIDCYIDFEVAKRDDLFLNFREDTLLLTGLDAPDWLIKKAEKYLFETKPEYKIFENV